MGFSLIYLLRWKESQLDEVEPRNFFMMLKKKFEMELYERCCSTSYYAMFHAAKAMILCIEKDSKTHRGTIYLV